MNNLNEKSILNTISSIIPCNIEETPLGQGLALDPRTAFLISCISDAVYLENNIYPFSPKGLLKILSSAFEYNFVTGIYEGHLTKYAPIELAVKRKYLFSGKKFFVPLSIDSETDFREKIKKKLKKKNNNNLLILKIDKSKKGSGLESYLELLASLYFSKKGFITETQVPLSYHVGSADFLACIIPEIQKNNSIQNYLGSGFNPIELSSIRVFASINKKYKSYKTIEDNLFLIGEVKTESATIKTQLLKYSELNIFNRLLEIRNQKKYLKLEDYSSFSVENDEIYYRELNKSTFIDVESQKKYIEWYKKYCALYLISNLRYDEMNDLSFKILKKPVKASSDIVNLISSSTFTEIVDEIFNYF